MNIDRLQEELSRFADPGAGGLTVDVGPKGVVATLTRNGVAMTLTSADFHQSPILLSSEGLDRKFSSYRALLSSSYFADLTLWASRQKDVLAPKFVDVPQITPNGYLEPAGAAIEGFERIEAEMEALQSDACKVRVLLIDGPAGVGKTHLIERLAFNAAKAFSGRGSRLYLHVRSRGKVLSNIDDLMASSLQTLRLNVTFDQVPVLVRHGLVVLVVDGFDELGDPEGYGHAWGQVNVRTLRTHRDLHGRCVVARHQRHPKARLTPRVCSPGKRSAPGLTLRLA